MELRDDPIYLLKQTLSSSNEHTHNIRRNNIWQRLHIDLPLLCGVLVALGIGLVILFSAANENLALVWKQLGRIAFASLVMFGCAQIPPARYKLWAPVIFVVAIVMLVAVLFVGHVGKGAQRWLSLGLFRFQPSELMKISLPLMMAWFLHDKQLPPCKSTLLFCGALLVLPLFLVAKQPDLGTALLLAGCGTSVLFLAGINWRFIFSIVALGAISTPVLWHFMHDYQRQRVLTFLNPERDPLGSGYHIIQSKIAIGSGGLFGKGWLNGTQSHLNFLPEHATDFIFAVTGEEFGLLGCIALLLVYLYICARSLYICSQAQDTFSRLLGGGLSLMFFLSVFVNIGMVSGLLPVVGVPLPLISYGGTSMVTLLAGFGVIMSIHTHRKLLTT